MRATVRPRATRGENRPGDPTLPGDSPGEPREPFRPTHLPPDSEEGDDGMDEDSPVRPREPWRRPSEDSRTNHKATMYLSSVRNEEEDLPGAPQEPYRPSQPNPGPDRRTDLPGTPREPYKPPKRPPPANPPKKA